MTTNGEGSNRQLVASWSAATVSGCRPVAGWTIVGKARLDGGDRRNVDRLRRACEAAARIDLKIELDEADHLDRPIHLLALAGDEVIGYAGITTDDEAEACGMVHPSWRRRGAGTALLEGLRAAARSLGHESILLICEDAWPAGLAWFRRLGATHEASEHRMVVRPAKRPMPGAPATPVELRPASDADHAAVVAVLGEDYSDGPGEFRLVGVEGETVIGTVRLTETTQRTMIYGFVIDEPRRGERLGTRMLGAVFDRLRTDGVREVGLEVNPDNTPAVRLYERFGFETVTTYRYMRLAITPLEHPDQDRAPVRRGGAR